MAGVQVRVLDNNRIAVRGASRRDFGVGLTVDYDERVPVTVDWSAWLGSDTIASVTNEAVGSGVTAASNTTKTASFSITRPNYGLIEHRITTAAGHIKEIAFHINGAEGFFGGRTYYE